MQMAWAENISGEEEEMDSTDECDVVSQLDAWRIEAAECGGELNNAGRSTWNAACRAAADQPLWKKYA